MSDRGTILASLGGRAKYLHLTLEADGVPGWIPLSDFARSGDGLDEGFRRVREFTPGMDDKACAALLIGELAFYLCYVVAVSGRGGLPLDPQAGAVHVRWITQAWEDEGETGLENRMHLWIDGGYGPAPQGEAARAAIVNLLEPVIEHLTKATGLGRAALWRQAADNVAAAWLTAGRELGDEENAVTEAIGILRTPGSKLTNKQTGFMVLTAQDEHGNALTERFRKRGGCCRIYTGPDGGYCSTCVLRPEHEIAQRLRDYLLRKLQRTEQK